MRSSALPPYGPSSPSRSVPKWSGRCAGWAIPTPHWFWLSDVLLHRTALFDADTGDAARHDHLGHARRRLRDLAAVLARPPRDLPRRDLLLARRARRAHRRRHGLRRAARSRRCTRSAIPPKRAEYFPGNAANALSDDGRFVAVFNLTPMTSLVDRRRAGAALRRRGADARAAASSTPPARDASSCCAPTATALLGDARRRRPARQRRRAPRRSSTRRRTRSPRRRCGAATSGSSSRSRAWSTPVDVSGDGAALRRAVVAVRRRRPRARRGASAAASTSPCTAATGRLYALDAPGRPRHPQGARARRCGSTTSRAASACSASRC